MQINSSRKTVLLAEDDPSHLEMLATVLRGWGYNVETAKSGVEAVLIFEKSPDKIDLFLADMRMPGLDGLESMKKVKVVSPELPVIIMTAYLAVDDAVEVMRNGAYDYIAKPVDLQRLKHVLEACLEKEPQKPEGKDFSLGKAPAILKVEEMVRAAAPTEAIVLITGESGTGKEVVAKTIHARSRRGDKPFLGINCGAFSQQLIESELFGHERGSFTGAEKQKTGLFSEAEDGTLFLDEIGEMPLAMQVKLLRVLQEREFMRVGGQKNIPLECRIIAATNRNLQEEVKAGRFREDLFYRLNVLNINLPPLRERKEDILNFAGKFAEKFARDNYKTFKGITRNAANALIGYDWPGNLRELENVMERAIILMLGEYIDLKLLPESIANPKLGGNPENEKDDDALNLQDAEKNLILRALEKCNNNKSMAARMLGITRKTLYAKLAAMKLPT